jgi:hypothetical protein
LNAANLIIGETCWPSFTPSPPAPVGLRGAAALTAPGDRRNRRQEYRNGYRQTKSATEGRAPQQVPSESWSGSKARNCEGPSELEAGEGPRPFAPAGRGIDCRYFQNNRLAAALGARFLAGVVRKKLQFTLESANSDGVRIYRIVVAKSSKPKGDAAAAKADAA